MEFKEQSQLEDNGIYSLMQWSQLLSIRISQFIMMSTSKFSLMEKFPLLQSLNTTNNETDFPELTRVFKEQFEMKVQEGSVLK